jgi:hypothetical protein
LRRDWSPPSRSGRPSPEQRGSTRRLGEILVTNGALSRAALERFLHHVPGEPGDLGATGIDEASLLNLLIKQVYRGKLDSLAAMADAIKLPPHLVSGLVALAITRRWLSHRGEREQTLRYDLTDEGARWAQDALQQGQYARPALVSLDAFATLIDRQKISNVVVDAATIRSAFADLIVDDAFIERIGPGLNSGRAMLLYGPPGNGKTSVAHRFARIFDDIIYVPYAVQIDGQIMRVFDPRIHRRAEAHPSFPEAERSILRPEAADSRWVPCHRPFVATGGELTLDMLELQYNATAKDYEAPLHIKALGGCFVIDDFGRQMLTPRQLLNRWIVPMENRVDTLTLQSGKSFSVPFELMLVFSTNLDPEDLMDPAFLRRLPYKPEVGAPEPTAYRRIFEQACAAHGLTLSDTAFERVLLTVTATKGLPLAAYQPQFIVDQLVATCRFMGQPPTFEPRFIEYAIDNLRVRAP